MRKLKTVLIWNRIKGRVTLGQEPYLAKLTTYKKERPKEFPVPKKEQKKTYAKVIQRSLAPFQADSQTWQHCPHSSNFRIRKDA